jgi:hypothetical protein
VTLTPLAYWGVIVILAIQVAYNVDGWYLTKQAHRGWAAFGLAIAIGILLWQGLR